MSLPKPTAENYERLHPQTGISDAQKQERMERKVFKAEAQRGLRTGRNRGIVVPDLPWLRDETTNLKETSDAAGSPEAD